MKALALVAALFAPLSFCFGQIPARRSPISTAQLAQQRLPSVVTVTTSTGFGSGVIVDSSGVIATNLHVVRGSTKVAVKLASGDTYDDVSVVDVDEHRDILLLRIKGFALTSAPLGNSDQVRVGDKVILIGSPKGLERTVSEGVVSAIRDTGDGYRLIQTSAAASPGSSGGAMFNDFGELIGIVSSKLTGGENLNFAIPVNYVRGMLSTEIRMTLAELARQYPDSAPASAPESSATATPPSSQTSGTAATTKLLNLLEASGLNYKKGSDSRWSVSYRGDILPVVQVVISVYDDLVLVQSMAAEKPSLSVPQLTEILKLNFSTDLAKASLADGDLTVLNETELRLIDPQGLERIVNAVALLTDDLAGVARGMTEAAVEVASNLATPPNRGSLAWLELLQGRFGIRYDPTQWKTTNSNETGVFQFQHASGDVYVRIISERIEVPLDRMPDVVLENVRDSDANAKIVRRATRSVNGVRMLLLEYEAVLNGVSWALYGHYYSNGSGTIQVVGFTGRNLIKEARPIIEQFVSGFEVAP